MFFFLFVSFQVCEMHVAGYNFVVLDTGFIVHKGFKEKGEFYAKKDEENRRNRQLFFQLQSESDLRLKGHKKRIKDFMTYTNKHKLCYRQIY